MWTDERAHNMSMADYETMYAESITDPGAFWAKIANEFDWKGAPIDAATALEYNFDRTKGDIFINWFAGSQTNLAHNCLDRQIALGRGDQIALYVERNEKDEVAGQSSYTYGELTAEVNRLANALKSQGVEKGDRVTIFMAHVPENWWVRGTAEGCQLRFASSTTADSSIPHPLASLCSRALVSARFTRWCLAAFRRRRWRAASSTVAQKL